MYFSDRCTATVRTTAQNLPYKLLLIASFRATCRFQFGGVGVPRAFPEGFLPTEITPKLAYSFSMDPVSPDVPILPIQSERRPLESFLHGVRNNFMLCSKNDIKIDT